MSHLNESGWVRWMFSYIPLIPHLCALMSNETYATCLQYCADEHKKTHMPRTKMDIFDGLHYRSLLGQRVVVGGQRLTHNYFSDDRDIALGFAMDGFAPFKKWKHTTWILLIFNYNLPLDKRFQKDNILCAGIIPGPKKPWDTDSFIYPLVQELLELMTGVSAYDALLSSLFVLHAYSMSSLALVTFLPFPWLCIWKDTIPCVPVECVRSKVFASPTCETTCSIYCCPASIILHQPVLLSMIRRTYHCVCTITLWHRQAQWIPHPQKYGKRNLQRHMASKGSPFSVLLGPWGFPSHFHTTSCI